MKATHRSFPGFVLGLCLTPLLCASVVAQPLDAEDVLALDREAGEAYSKLVMAANLTPEQRKERRGWLAERYPNSIWVVRCQADALAEATGDWKRYFPEAAKFLDAPHHGGLYRREVIALLAKTVVVRTAPDDVRRGALDVLLPRVQNAAATLYQLRIYINSLPLNPVEKWNMARKATEVCGYFPSSRAFLWYFLPAYSKVAPSKEVQAELEWFLDKFGEESAESMAARQGLLTLRSREGDAASAAQLKLLQEQEAKSATEVAQIYGEAAALAATDESGALAKLEKLQGYPERNVDSRWWSAFMRSLKVPANKLKASMLAVKYLPPGLTLDEIWDQVRDLSSLPEAGDFGIEYVAKSGEDNVQSYNRLRALLRFPIFDNDEQRNFKVHLMAAEMWRKIGTPDQEAEYRFMAGKYGWDIDRPTALASLRRAVEIAPNSSGGAQAAWFLSLLEGKHGILQGPLPRGTQARQNWQAPEVALPKFTGEGPLVTDANKRIALRQLDAKTNLLEGQLPAVSAGANSASLATDGKAETMWQPGKFPATMVVPLRMAASPQRLALSFNQPTYFTVSLLDAEGKTISRTERDWRFWEYYQAPALWPAADTTLEFVPTGTAYFVKVEMYSTLGVTPGLKEIACYPTPYPALAWNLEAPAALPGNTLNVKWNSDEPQQDVTLLPSTESTRGYPNFRWGSPWVKSRGQLTLRRIGPRVSMDFYGTNVKLALRRAGRVLWWIDGVKNGTIDQNDERKARDATVHPLIDNMEAGRHQLVMTYAALDTEEDNVMAQADPLLSGVQVTGKSRASKLIRFGDGKTWGPWNGPLADPAGTIVSAYDKINGKAPTHYQIATLLDSRETQGTATATSDAATSITAQPGGKGGELDAFEIQKPFTRENVDAVLSALQKRSVVVTYPKEGSREEYEAAKRLADKAGVYLVSDDVVLGGNFWGGVLAVGTPLSQRLARQLPAAVGLWEDPAYLNSPNGLVGDAQSTTGFGLYFVTGETPAAVVKAAARVEARLAPPTAAAQPLRTFSADTLEMVYPWQVHAERSAPSLTLRMAQNDRRPLQFGVNANVDIKDLQVVTTALTGPGGATLPAPLARPVAFYEWAPFFGEMRLPDLLAPGSIDLSANTSCGIWLTMRSKADTKPGLYKGSVTVKGNNVTQSVPIQVTVEPIALTTAYNLSTFSFASMPWMFHEGTAEFDRCLRQLAENEAEHGVNTVNPPLTTEWKVESPIIPLRYAVGPANAAPADLAWQPYGEGNKPCKPGEAIFFEFEKTATPRLLAGAFQVTKAGDISGAAYTGGQWKEMIAQQPPYVGAPMGVEFSREATPLQYARFSAAEGLTIARLNAFADPEGDGPIAYNASATFKCMDVFEDVYRKRGLPLPDFLCYASIDRTSMAMSVFGMGDANKGGYVIGTDFGRYLHKELEKTGRSKRFAIKYADEPSDFAEWTTNAGSYLKGGLQVMTCHSGNYNNIEVGIGTINPWCPNYQHDVLRPFFKERQKAGDKVWWYICGVPYTRITGTPIENLPFYWLSAKWGFDGAMNYATLTGGEANEAVPFRYDHGLFHRAVALPDGSIVDSTRRELEGDGIQDFRLIDYIRLRAAALRKANQGAAADGAENKLNKIISDIVPYKYGYSQKPQDWYAARDALYDLATSMK